MNKIKKCFLRIKQRPMTFVFLLLVTGALSALEQYNPFTKQYGSLKFFMGINFLDMICRLSDKLSEIASSPKLLVFIIGVGLIFLLALAVVFGLIFSGFFHQMSLSSFDKDKRRGEFRTGIGRYTGKLTGYFFLGSIIMAVLLLLSVFATIPAVLAIKLVLKGNTGMITSAIFLSVLSLFVIIFTLLFYAMYLTFIIPSIICFKKGGGNVGIRMVNAYCWYLMPRTLLFLAVDLALRVLLLAIHYGLDVFSASVCILVATSLIRTLIYFIYIYYSFNTFSAMKSDMFDEGY